MAGPDMRGLEMERDSRDQIHGLIHHLFDLTTVTTKCHFCVHRCVTIKGFSTTHGPTNTTRPNPKSATTCGTNHLAGILVRAITPYLSWKPLFLIHGLTRTPDNSTISQQAVAKVNLCQGNGRNHDKCSQMTLILAKRFFASHSTSITHLHHDSP